MGDIIVHFVTTEKARAEDGIETLLLMGWDAYLTEKRSKSKPSEVMYMIKIRGRLEEAK